MEVDELKALTKAVGRMVEANHPEVGFIIILNVPHETNRTALKTAAHSNMIPQLAGQVLQKCAAVYINTPEGEN